MEHDEITIARSGAVGAGNIDSKEKTMLSDMDGKGDYMDEEGVQVLPATEAAMDKQ